MTTQPLGPATWQTVPARATVLVPLGSVEQHGPHLPLDTDTVIAAAVARRAAELADGTSPGELLVAPAQAYGASGEHQHFPGTSSIGSDALHSVLVELVRSMRTWAQRVVFVNGHGGNQDALHAASTQLRQEGHDVIAVPCTPPAEPNIRWGTHAGRAETSLLLHLQPRSVRLAQAQPGATEPFGELLPALRRGGIAAVSANGVLGDPTGAHAQEGHRLLDAMARLVAATLTSGDAAAASGISRPVPG